MHTYIKQLKKNANLKGEKEKEGNKPSHIHQEQHPQHPYHGFGHQFRQKNRLRPCDQNGTCHGRA